MIVLQNKLSDIKTRLPSMRSNLGARLTLSIGLLIIVTSIFLFLGIYRLERQQALQQIDAEAQALLNEMIVTREWVSHYNGIWTTSPGDYHLDAENGFYRKSPAMVTKELSDLSNDKGDYRFHITSLDLINPANAPDDYEHDVLVRFEQDPVTISSIDRTGDIAVYRSMIPLMVEESCLECHLDQGYEIGDVRGGLSVLIPIDKVDQSLANSGRALILAAISITGLVMAVLYIMVRQMVIKPVGQLKLVAAAVGEGDYEVRSTLSTGDELEVFGQTLNQMTSNLKTSRDSLNDRIQRRTQELDAISEVTLAISRATNLDEVLEEALFTIASVANAAGGVIQLFGRENTWVAAQHAVPAPIINCLERIQYDPNYRQGLQQPSSPFKVMDVETSICQAILPGAQCPPDEGCGTVSDGFCRIASVLLSSRQRALGVLTLFSANPDSFSPESMQLLACIGRQLGVAVENVRLHQRTEEIATLEERSRISRELHDSLAQTLGWLRIKTEILEDDIRLGEIDKTHTDITAIQRVVRDACYDIRESIDGLRSRPTGDLMTTAAAWISEFRQRSGLRTEFRSMVGEVRLSAMVEAELMRILQEALTNVRKHAGAKKVRVDFQVKGEFAELQIEDDGCGFEYRADQDDRHFGLRIMRERAERLGGSFEVDTSVGEGTRITASLPLYHSTRLVNSN